MGIIWAVLCLFGTGMVVSPKLGIIIPTYYLVGWLITHSYWSIDQVIVGIFLIGVATLVAVVWLVGFNPDKRR